MRKFLKVAACGLIMAAVVTGCSKKAAEETTPAETTTGDYCGGRFRDGSI